MSPAARRLRRAVLALGILGGALAAPSRDLPLGGVPVAHAAPGAPAADVAAVRSTRRPCRITKTMDAGADAAERPLRVVEVALHTRQGDWKSPDFEKCAPYELWALAGTRGQAPTTKQLLLTACNDGYGAAGRGEDKVEVKRNLVIHERTGGSAWSWDKRQEARLFPPKLLREANQGEWNLRGNESEGTFDWETLRGRVAWAAPDCKGAGTDDDDKAELKRYAYSWIPQVELPAAHLAAGWRTTALGACAVEVDSSGKGGFVTHGKPGAAADARLRVLLATKRDLLIEVEDDHLVTGSRSWLTDDHVELWLGPATSYADQCVDPKLRQSLRQWGIRIADGAVFPAFGKPRERLAVERVAVSGAPGGPAVVRLKVTLPADAVGVTVVYSDSDDGKTQKRLIATSQVKLGVAASLGRARPVPATVATCVAAGGRLQIRDQQRYAADQPVLGDD